MSMSSISPQSLRTSIAGSDTTPSTPTETPRVPMTPIPDDTEQAETVVSGLRTPESEPRSQRVRSISASPLLASGSNPGTSFQTTINQAVHKVELDSIRPTSRLASAISLPPSPPILSTATSKYSAGEDDLSTLWSATHNKFMTA